MRHSVDTKLLQEVLNYLANRPYTEVSNLISKLQADVKAVEEVTKEEQVNEG
jgi:hypothetical protein